MKKYFTNKEEFIRFIENFYPGIGKIGNIDDVPEWYYSRIDDPDCWKKIIMRFVLSEDFMRKNKEKMVWDYVEIHQDLSEPFIDEFKDILNFNVMIWTQKMSLLFVRSHHCKFKDTEIVKELFLDPKTRKSFGLEPRSDDWIEEYRKDETY